jgi:CheY-like chemotaxis protein
MTTLKKVLVVDDDPVVGKSFERVLQPKGYAVIHASSGEEALERIQAENYDMVYTDIKMPGMDGIEVAKRIKSSRPWLPVVIVTGYGSDENEGKAWRAGISEFLRKPLSPEMIETSANLAFTSVALSAPQGDDTVIPLPAGRRGAAGFLKNVGLFVAAPFIALAYVALFPFIGLGMLAFTAYEAFAGRKQD